MASRILLISIIFFQLFVLAQESQSEDSDSSDSDRSIVEINKEKNVKLEKTDYILCKNRQFARTVNVDWNEQEKTCTTYYTKYGNSKVVGSGININSCRQFLNNIRHNLQKAGWECKSIDNAKVVVSNGDN